MTSGNDAVSSGKKASTIGIGSTANENHPNLMKSGVRAGRDHTHGWQGDDGLMAKKKGYGQVIRNEIRMMIAYPYYSPLGTVMIPFTPEQVTMSQDHSLSNKIMGCLPVGGIAQPCIVWDDGCKRNFTSFLYHRGTGVFTCEAMWDRRDRHDSVVPDYQRTRTQLIENDLMEDTTTLWKQRAAFVNNGYAQLWSEWEWTRYAV